MHKLMCISIYEHAFFHSPLIELSNYFFIVRVLICLNLAGMQHATYVLINELYIY